MLARDIMDTRFFTLSPEDTIGAAIRAFQNVGKELGKKVFGLMVTDAEDRLVGMLSMYDILLFMQPKHIQIWGGMPDMDMQTLFDASFDRVKNIVTGDLMTTELVTIGPETHLLLISDIMIKKHVRRLPVIEKERVLGIVYISDVFSHLLGRFWQAP